MSNQQTHTANETNGRVNNRIDDQANNTTMTIYLVGGAVRDQLLNVPYHEKDWVVVGSNPEEMIKLGYTPVGKDFPVFLHPKTHEEYALARTERKTAPGYRGFTFHTDKQVSLEEDLQRRDLTINAMAKSHNGEIIDPYQGQNDLDNRLLRHVSNAFNEDPVRILRVARFLARYHYLGFTIAEETTQLMIRMVKQKETKHLVAERVWQECQKALSEKNPECFFTALSTCSALSDIFPCFENNDITPCLALLKITAEHTQNNIERFAAFCFPLPLETISELNEQLATPNEFKTLALLVKENYLSYAQNDQWTGKSLSQFFTQCDALRKPERFQQILTACYAITLSGNNKILEHNEILLLDALKVFNQVDHQALIKKGFQKAALGDAIKKKRIELLDQWLEKRA